MWFRMSGECGRSRRGPVLAPCAFVVLMLAPTLPARDAADTVEARSVVVPVDDEDRDGLARAAASQALGLFVAAPDDLASRLASGRHVVVARVCTIGGACAEARAEVNAVEDEPHCSDRWRSLLELIMSLAGHSLRTYTSYDLAGRVSSTRSVGADINGAGEQTLYVRNFYTAGLLDSVQRWSAPDTNHIGTVATGWRYDRAGRKIQEVASDGAIDAFQYDPAGNLTRSTPRRGGATVMQYDALDRLTQRSVPSVYHAHDGSFPRYDGGAGLTIPADVQTFGYDAEGHLRYARNADAWIGRTYFPNGALKTDTLRIRTWSGNDFDQHKYVLAYGYDLDGRRTSLTLPPSLAMKDRNGTTVLSSMPSTYTAWGQLASVGIVRFVYDLDARIDSIVRPGLNEKRLYDDPDGNLTRRIVRQSAATRWNGTNSAQIDTVIDERLTFDPRGKVTGADEIRRCRMTQYSGLGAVVRMTTTHPCVIGAIDDEYYTVDALGNLFRSNIVPDAGSAARTDFTYQVHTGRETENRSPLQTVGAITYDPAGNRHTSSRSEWYDGPSGQTPLDVSTYFYYDAEQRLRTVDRRTSQDLLASGSLPFSERGSYDTYRYDALGRRVLVRAQRDSACAAACQSYIQRTVWDGDQILYEIRYPGNDSLPNAALERDTGFVSWEQYHLEDDLPRDSVSSPHVGRVLYVHGAGIDQPLFLLRADYGRSTARFDPFRIDLVTNWRGQIATGVYNGGLESTKCELASFYVANHGTERDTTLVCVEIDWSEPNTVYRKRSSFDHRSWFGTLLDDKKDASGLLYMRNRYYDPQSGRFTQEDPIGLAGGLNLYGFASGDPVNFSDPFGLCPVMPCRSPDDGMNDRPLPPGVDEKDVTWNPKGWYDLPDGRRIRPHPEDETHWDHWEIYEPGKKQPQNYPEKKNKPWPGQKVKPYGDQSGVDPWPLISPYTIKYNLREMWKELMKSVPSMAPQPLPGSAGSPFPPPLPGPGGFPPPPVIPWLP